MRRSLAQTHIARNDGIEHQVPEMAFHLFIHLVAQSQTVVKHRQQEAFDLQLRIQFRFDDLDRIQQLGDTFQRKELALHRNDHAVACGQRIDGDQTQGRAAVYQNIIIFVAHLRNHVLQQLLATLHIQHFDLRSHKVNMTRNETQILRVRRYNGCVRINSVHQTLIDRVVQLANLYAQTGRRVRLRIGVDQQNALT